jgi:hypothetical protein
MGLAALWRQPPRTCQPAAVTTALSLSSRHVADSATVRARAAPAGVAKHRGPIGLPRAPRPVHRHGTGWRGRRQRWGRVRGVHALPLT